MKLIPNSVTRAVGKQTLVLKQHSPRIMFVTGIVGAVGATVLACRATLKLHEVLDEAEAEISSVRTDLKGQPGYNRDVAYIYAKHTVSMVRLYAPAVVVGSASIALLTGSHLQLSRRNAGLSMAYAAVTTAYDEYRERVRTELGVDRELDLYLGAETVTITDESGKNHKVRAVGNHGTSPYAQWFDSTNRNWQHNQEYNRIFLQAQQSYANHLLQARGHVFLNEIYSNLGIEHTSAGALVGWVLGNGDNFIDFGIYDVHNADSIEFGENADLLLDFNVDGEVWKLIG